MARELVSKPKEASCVAIVISALAHEELEKRTGTEEYRIHRIDLNLVTAKLQTKVALALPLLRRLQQIGQAVKQMTGRVRPQPFVRPREAFEGGVTRIGRLLNAGILAL